MLLVNPVDHEEAKWKNTTFYIIENRPGAIGFTIGFSQDRK